MDENVENLLQDIDDIINDDLQNRDKIHAINKAIKAYKREMELAELKNDIDSFEE
jgi:hypothetical protein